MLKNYFFDIPKDNKLSFYLLVLFPIFLILGNLFINIFYLTFFLISLFNFKEFKNFYLSTLFYLLLFFLFCLLLNILFSINFINSFPRFLKFLMIIFLIKEMCRIVINDKFLLDKVFPLWCLVFLTVTLDVIFELIFGFNTLGFKPPIGGRIASFFGDELVVGGFYHFFSLLVIAYLINKKFSNPKIFILAILIIIISFMIGERANFLKLFTSVLIFLFLIIKTHFIKKIGIATIILSLLGLIVLNNENLQLRYYDQLRGDGLNNFTINGIKKYYKESQYGAQQNTAFQIFKKNIFFGIGLKNYRDESIKKIYENNEYKKTNWREATHPHQIHLELLSETGLVGYISFLILILYTCFQSIKNYFKSKNLYLLSTILYLISSLTPFLPTGSIFSTFYGGMFWFNFALMIGLSKVTKS